MNRFPLLCTATGDWTLGSSGRMQFRWQKEARFFTESGLQLLRPVRSGTYEVLAMKVQMSRTVFRFFLGCLNWQRPFLRVVQVNRLTIL